MNEIERKFAVRALPDLSNIKPISYERYYLSSNNNTEKRISKIGEKYYLEYKIEVSDIERTRSKKEITVEEFINLKKIASKVIARDKYRISEYPNISIQIYRGEFEGLVRAEVEFASIDEANAYRPPEWMGVEITGSVLDRDSKLIRLSRKEFILALGEIT